MPVELVPEPMAVLNAVGPLAADGVGRLLMLLPAGDGYAVTRYFPETHTFETIYRRKSAVGRALAVAPDGSFCIGTLTGVDCVSERGHTEHYVHPLLTNVSALTFTADGAMWVLRSTTGSADNLQLVRAEQRVVDVQPVLTLRQSVQGFTGNSIAPAADGGVYVAVIENDIYRLVHVDPTGRLTRSSDLWRPGGAVAAAAGDVLLVSGVKRPQSLQEQRRPVDVMYYVIGRRRLARRELSGRSTRFLDAHERLRRLRRRRNVAHDSIRALARSNRADAGSGGAVADGDAKPLNVGSRSESDRLSHTFP